MRNILEKIKNEVYELLKECEPQSKANDYVEYIISTIICLNVILIIFESIELDNNYNFILKILRIAFFVFFLIEYILRLWISDIVMHDNKHPIKARIQYILSIRGIIDLLALLPVLLKGTFIDFRIFRILRLLRLTQLKSLKRYTDILVKVFKLKGAQLLSSLFIVLIFMLVSAVVIYDLESSLQPDVYKNVLSGLWWSMSAITTIGYGDMYPISPLGKIFGSCISIFGVFLMAIPIGILTSGFFEIAKDANSKNRKE